MTTKTTRPKAPQDHQPSAEEKQKDFTQIEGHELLVPITSLRPSDMARIQYKLVAAFSGAELEEGEEPDVHSIDFEKLADVMELIEARYVLDDDAWDAFGRENGTGAVQELVVGYASAMGKGSRSTNG